jgi:hypothetical protein
MVGLRDNIKISQEEFDRLLNLQKKWYCNNYILIEIIKNLKDRELSFILHKSIYGKSIALRFFKTPNSIILKRHLERVGLNERIFNCYMSVSLLKEFGYFSYNFTKRKLTPEYEHFLNNYQDYMIGYNLFIDFDGKENFEECYEQAKLFKLKLEENKIPYWLMNSSSKGFHFHTPYEYIDSKYPIKDLPNIFFEVISELNGIYGLEDIDKKINDYARLCKLPYSFNVDGCICMPLTDEMFNNFKKEIVEVDFVLKNYRITNRGLLLRDYGLSKEELKKNVIKFIDKYK